MENGSQLIGTQHHTLIADRDGAYLQLSDTDFRGRLREAYRHLERCDLCPRQCGARRLEGRVGPCGAGLLPKVFVWNLHRGEEPPVSGTRGSGAVFFSGCNLRCCYCQNYPLSQMQHGNVLTIMQLADALLELQEKGAHNINFVTPSHQVPQLLAAVYVARKRGLRIPLVYNTSSYDSLAALALLRCVIDIYLGDLRYTDPAASLQLSGAADYVNVAEEALREMYRQVGNIELDAAGRYIPHGLIVRYLILPRHTSMARSVFRFVHNRLSPQTYVSIMTQYFPAYHAVGDHSLGIWRELTETECDRVMRAWDESGLMNGWAQDMDEPGGA